MMKKMVLLSLACHIALVSLPFHSKISYEAFTPDHVDVVFVNSIPYIAEPEQQPFCVPKAAAAKGKPSGKISLIKASYQGLNNPLPPYPLVARKRGHEGNVTLTLHISASGQCKLACLIASSGHTSLDEAALKTVSSWHFNPARRGNKNTEDQLDVTFKFTLTGLEVA